MGQHRHLGLAAERLAYVGDRRISQNLSRQVLRRVENARRRRWNDTADIGSLGEPRTPVSIPILSNSSYFRPLADATFFLFESCRQGSDCTDRFGENGALAASVVRKCCSIFPNL